MKLGGNEEKLEEKSNCDDFLNRIQKGKRKQDFAKKEKKIQRKMTII